jgi:hypothetical protein
LVQGSTLCLLSQLFHPPKSRTGDGTRRPTLQYFHALEQRHVTCSQLAYYLCEKTITPMFNIQFIMTKKDRKEVESKRNQAIRRVQSTLTKQL